MGLKQMKTIEKITSNVFSYNNGFIINGKNYPFYNFSEPNLELNEGWSKDLADYLEETSETHFIDIYNRKVAFNGIKAKLANNANYIDIGCGSGYMINSVYQSFPEINIFGADYFKQGLLDCHNKFPNIPLFQMDLLKCPFTDNCFDAITCLNVLEHIKEDNKAIAQLYRILKPKGRLVISVPAGPTLYDMYDEIHLHERRYSLFSLKYQIKKAGFKIKKANYLGFFLYPAFYLVKKKNKILYNRLSSEEKKEKVYNLGKSTQKSYIMQTLCLIERCFGRMINFPFGIRTYIVAEK